MQQSTTDIDRKLAIYYHPLFQQTISLLTDLFQKDFKDMNESRSYANDKQVGQQNPKPQLSQNKSKFTLGLMEFIQFNLKLQKSLLPTFQSQNAIISSLNDWVKEVAQCLNFDGMVIMSNTVQINDSNIQSLLRTEMMSSKMQLYETTQKYIKTLLRLKNHDAFKLLGVKVNKQVFSKFMFDLCSTWCQFLDIQMFVYFLIAIYLQISEGQTLKQSKFKSSHLIQPIDLQFMEQFEEIKLNYSKNRKKQLRYYRAWCQWNYLRVGEVGQGLILCLDNILNDNRVLQIALVFQKAIKVINQQITSQSNFQSPQQTMPLQSKQSDNKDFLILKKINTKQQKSNLQPNNNSSIQKSIQSKKEDQYLQNSIENNNDKNYKNIPRQKSIQKQGTIRIHSRNQTISEDQLQGRKTMQKSIQQKDQIEQNSGQNQNQAHHDFQIQIDQFGNMFLKRVVKLPIFGAKIQPLQFDKKRELKTKWIQKKRLQCRKVSNLYRRLQNMKVRLEHNIKNDHYFYKKNPILAERDQFYQNQNKNTSLYHQKTVNKQLTIFQKSIHQKLKPQASIQQQNQNLQYAKPNAKTSHYRSTFKSQKQNQPIRSNPDYIHKVIAPSFLTDHKNNISYLQDKQGNIYGTGAQDQRRDIKFNLPKIKFLRDYKVKNQKSYHIVGKLIKDRSIINDRVKSISLSQANNKSIIQPLGIPTEQDKIDKLKNEYHHVWTKYINEQQIQELTNFKQFYHQLQNYKKKFSHQFESAYRQNLRPIFLYQNKRYEMGGIITKKQEQRFYQKMKRLINRDERRKKKKQRKNRFRQYKRNFKNKEQRSFYEEVFINYHKDQIKQIKQERSRIKSQIVQMSSTSH